MTHDDKHRNNDDTDDDRRDAQGPGGDPSAEGAQVPPGKWSDGGDPSAKRAQVPPGKWSEGSQGSSGEQDNRTDTTSPNDNESENAGVRPPLDHERVV